MLDGHHEKAPEGAVLSVFSQSACNEEGTTQGDSAEGECHQVDSFVLVVAVGGRNQADQRDDDADTGVGTKGDTATGAGGGDQFTAGHASLELRHERSAPGDQRDEFALGDGADASGLIDDGEINGVERFEQLALVNLGPNEIGR